MAEGGPIAAITGALVSLILAVAYFIRRRAGVRARKSTEANMPAADEGGAPPAAHRHNTMSLLADEVTVYRARIAVLEGQLAESLKKNADDRERLLREAMTAVQPLADAVTRLVATSKDQAEAAKVQAEAFQRCESAVRELEREIRRGGWQGQARR